jgi:short subunit dehydrogenase-like uncharacterized protein
MRPTEREFDVVLWGATGFTGRLVAAYLLERCGRGDSLRWALGGRSEAGLRRVREDLGAPELPLVLGDAADAASLAALAARTRVVCTSVGPYARYGSGLVAACARAGTRYCDLTGELPWIRRMIEAHQAEAEASGALLVPSCGFDSIPSDLGVCFVQREMRARHGAPSPHVKCRVAGFRGGVSGGTLASMLEMLEEAAADASVRRVLADPYALDPPGHARGPDGPDGLRPAFDADFGQWTAPFVMAAINTRVVRRSNALLADAYGVGFRYDEALLMGRGPLGAARASALAAGMGLGMAALSAGPLRRLLAPRLPQPGQGPSREQREKGYWDLRFWAAPPAGSGAEPLRARLRGDRDPGYGSTSKMLGESAACLALDPLEVGGGFHTPASAMGELLVDRLQKHAGVSFEVEA